MQAVEAIPMAHAKLRRLDLRVVAGLLLMLVAVVGGSSLIRNAQARTPVLVAAGTVQPGEVITASDLRVVEVTAPAGIAYLPASARSGVVGRVAAEPLWAGKVLGPGSLSDGSPLASGMVAFSLLLPPQSAVAGEIRAGDHVAVLASPGSDQAGQAGSSSADTTILFTDLPVLSVHQASGADGESLLVTLTLRLEEARALAQAKATGRVDLALVSGASP
jgi:Flp pilus assembly protein CpaB